jgi:hypothetical protein
MTEQQQALNQAVLYALKVGVLFPVPEPKLGASVEDLVRWGALRHLHDAIRAFDLAGGWR